MTLIKKLIVNSKQFNISRKVSIILFITLIITAQITSVLITIGIINFSQLLSNIKIPAGYVYIDIDIDSPETMTIQILYEIQNPGIYELSDTKITVDMRVNYINYSNHANITSHIFSKTTSVKNCKPLQKFSAQNEGSFQDFNISSFIKFYTHSDEFKMVYFFIDIQFSAKYVIGLIDFHFAQYNLNLYNL